MTPLHSDISVLITPITEWINPHLSVNSILGTLEAQGFGLVGTPLDLLGVITGKQVIRALRTHGTLEGVTVAETMEITMEILSNPQTCNPQEILEWMLQYEIDILPARDTHGPILGVITLKRLQEFQNRAIQKTQTHLLERESLYRALLENSPDIIERFDLNFRHLYVSPSLTRITGMPMDEFLGKTYREVGLSPLMVDLWESAATSVLETGHRQVIEFDTTTVRGIRTFEMILAPERDQDHQTTSLLCLSRDITDRKQIERQLREQENLKQSMLTALSEGIVMHQADGQIIFCNDSAPIILGLTRDQLLGRTSIDPAWTTLNENGLPFPGEDHPAMVTLRTGIPQRNVIMGVKRPDQSLVWISINTQPLFTLHEDGRWGALASFANVTEQKHLEIQLRSQLHQLRLLNQITQTIRQTLDSDAVLNTVVQEVRQFLQTDRVVVYQFLSDGSGQFVAESISSPCWSCLHQVVKDDCFAQEYIHQYESGRVRVISNVHQSDLNPCYVNLLEQFYVKACVVVPILQGLELWGLLIAHHCSQPREWDTACVDLMSQIANQLGIAIQQAQLLEQLRQTNKQLHYQIEVRNAELHHMVDYEQLIRLISDEVRSSLQEKEILQSTVRELADCLDLESCMIGFLNPDPQDHFTYTVGYDARESEGFVGQTVPLDAAIYHQLFRSDTLYLMAKHPLVGQRSILFCPVVDQQEVIGFLDLTRSPEQEFTPSEIRLAEQVANQVAIGIRQARLYQSVQHQVDQLMEVNQLKDEFVHMVSHELRTPLTNMKMALTLLEVRPEPEHQRRYIQMLRSEWQRELILVNELLELLALESGNHQVEISSVSLQNWIPALVETLQMRFTERQLQFEWHLSPELDPLRTDAHLLERIVLELLNNACKYTPPQERVCLSIFPSEGGALFQVLNTGVEIPSDQFSRIFDKFHRIPSLDRYQQGGTGLGLALVKKSVDLLQGEITVQSEFGATQFQLFVPHAN